MLLFYLQHIVVVVSRTLHFELVADDSILLIQQQRWRWDNPRKRRGYLEKFCDLQAKEEEEEEKEEGKKEKENEGHSLWHVWVSEELDGRHVVRECDRAHGRDGHGRSSVDDDASVTRHNHLVVPTTSRRGCLSVSHAEWPYFN